MLCRMLIAAVMSLSLALPLFAQEPLGPGQQEAAAADEVMKKIEGTWKIREGKNKGEPLTEEELTGNRVVVGENMIAVVDAKEAELYKAEFKIEVGKEPFTIDMISSMPQGGERKALGIFKLVDEGWVLCYGLTGERPKTFESTVETPTMLFVMTRVEKKK